MARSFDQSLQFPFGTSLAPQNTSPSLGLSKEYKDSDSPTGRWLRQFFALPALPVTEDDNAFAFILMASKREDNTMVDSFIDYVLESYIQPDCCFPPSLWADINLLEVTTTNACESFHLHLAMNVKSPHPNIFKFLEAFKHEQEKITLKQGS